MSCYHPIRGHRTTNGVVFSALSRNGDYVGSIELACGQCIGCRMRRASDWALRIMHEASLWPDSCFVTLTYERDALPPHGSLCHEDYQLFMKRLRKQRGKVRFYMCGEYGEDNFRPHYHACLFNVHFREDMVPSGRSGSGELFYDSPSLSKLWGHGIVSVQDLTPETASYTARYIMKKALGQDAETAYERVDLETGEIVQLAPEYAAMSLKPGIGAGWFDKYSSDIFGGDYAIANGAKMQTPKYYDKLYKRVSKPVIEDGLLVPDKFDRIEFARQKRAESVRADNTDDRRRVREKVHLAKVRSLKRDI